MTPEPAEGGRRVVARLPDAERGIQEAEIFLNIATPACVSTPNAAIFRGMA